MFGYNASSVFNLNKEDGVHKTVAGGYFSLLLKVMVFLFVLVKLFFMITTWKDTIRSIEVPTDFSELNVDFNQTGMTLFVELQSYNNDKPNLQPLDVESEEAKKHMRVQFASKEENVEKIIRSVPCSDMHFNHSI